MKLPAGYGSVIKLGGKRRKPYAVRITTGYEEDKDGVFRQKYKYLEYFEKRKDAMTYLSNYNAGIMVPEHKAAYEIPTFSEIYEKWFEYRTNQKKTLSSGRIVAYKTAYNNMEELHDLKFQNIRLNDLENCLRKYNQMSASTVGTMITVLHGMYNYAMKYEIVGKDYSKLLEAEHNSEPKYIHKPFTDDEIKTLWEHQDVKDVAVVLIMIYSGLRISEFLQLELSNIHIEERYMIGGIKTEAGRNRTIPISKKIIPLIESLYDSGNKYLYPTKKGSLMNPDTFSYRWKNMMGKVGMNHKTHDARHTCASLMERAGIDLLHRKLILGHAVNDITEKVYTHVPIEDLIADIDKI